MGQALGLTPADGLILLPLRMREHWEWCEREHKSVLALRLEL